MTTATNRLQLDSAVVLTTTGVFGRTSPPPESGIGPLMRVGGLSLFMRTILTLQRAQLTNVIVLSGEELAAARRTLREDRRLTLSLRWMPVREFPPEDPRTWQALAGEIRGACLVVGVQAVFAQGLIERLRKDLAAGQAGLVVHARRPPDGHREPPAGSVNPLVQHQTGRLVALHDWPAQEMTSVAGRMAGEIGWSVAADMVVLPTSLLALSGAAAEGREHETGARSQPHSLPHSLRVSSAGTRAGGRSAEREAGEAPTGRLLRPVSCSVTPLRVLLDQAAADGRARVLTASSDGQHWYHEVHSLADTGKAEGTLLRSLKGELEGFVDRYFNRKLSASFTRLFLRMGLSANAVTALSIVTGLAAAVSFSLGNYAAGVIGALLFQLSSVIDCCDGEVARVTFTESPFGERLDLMGDNFVHAAIFAGIAWSVFLQQAAGAWPWLPLALGFAAITANFLSLVLVLRTKRLRAENAWSSQAQAARSNFILKHVASRDFSVVILAFALLDRLDWFLWLAAIGTNAFWIMMAWMTRRPLPSRA
jgi:phosphatidylglycerophosphate synthase